VCASTSDGEASVCVGRHPFVTGKHPCLMGKRQTHTHLDGFVKHSVSTLQIQMHCPAVLATLGEVLARLWWGRAKHVRAG
jgi:hypothetical protein